MAARYLKATAYSETPISRSALGIDIQDFDYDWSRHSNGTTLVVKGVSADDLRELAAQLLEQADLLEG